MPQRLPWDASCCWSEAPSFTRDAPGRRCDSRERRSLTATQKPNSQLRSRRLHLRNHALHDLARARLSSLIGGQTLTLGQVTFHRTLDQACSLRQIGVPALVGKVVEE